MSEKVSEQTFWEKVRRFLKPISYLKVEYGKEICKAFLTAFNGVIHILFLEKVISALEQSDSERFHSILTIYLVYILMYEVGYFLIRKWGWMNTLPFTATNIYKIYLKSFIRMDNNKIELLGTGKLIGILREGARVWASLLSDGIEHCVNIFVGIIFTLYMVGRVDIYYSAIFLLLIIIFFFIIRWINKKLSVFRSIRYELRNTRLRYLVKIIMSKMEVLQADKLDTEVNILWHNSRRISEVSRDMATYRNFMKRLVPFILSLSIFFIFSYMGGKVLTGDISLSVIVGLTGTLIVMQNSITSALSFYVAFTKEFISVEKLWGFFDNTPQIQGYEEGKEFVYKKGSISLQHVSYGYDAEKPIFTDFSLDIAGSKITALVGPSGGGKSTLVKLISGYISPDAGEIVIDGQKLSEVSLKSYYGDVGYLTQEPSVFDGTIIENLLYAVNIPHPTSASKGEEQTAASSPLTKGGLEGGLDIDSSPISPGRRKLKEVSGEEWGLDIEKIIKLAHCEFIYDLPNGLETEIGERGIKLSGGQKQRLAIAKIFLKNPNIIILDEPTSALDSMSEQKITEAMHNLFKDRTVIIIAHRLQTVKHADEIIVIEAGKVVERGTHSSLVKEKGYYKEMLDLQSGF